MKNKYSIYGLFLVILSSFVFATTGVENIRIDANEQNTGSIVGWIEATTYRESQTFNVSIGATNNYIINWVECNIGENSGIKEINLSITGVTTGRTNGINIGGWSKLNISSTGWKRWNIQNTVQLINGQTYAIHFQPQSPTGSGNNYDNFYFGGGTDYYSTTYYSARQDNLGSWDLKTSNDLACIINYTLISLDVLDVIIDSPSNNSNINQSTDIEFSLYNVNGTSDCNIYHFDNNLTYNLLETKIGLINETTTFSFNQSYWFIGNNTLKINCTDLSNVIANESILLFVDTILPRIVYINYSIGTTQATLNNSVLSVNPKFNITVKTNDTNNYLLNLTLFYNFTKKVIKSIKAVNLSQSYILNLTVDLTNNLSGLYGLNVTSKDGHTLQSIDFSSDLKDSTIKDSEYIGKVIDEDVKIYSNVEEIKSFNLIQKQDRKQFDITFNKGIEYFDMIVEGETSVFYVGNKYGYLGHFIIDDKYWYDLENSDGASINIITKVSDKKYIVNMKKPINTERILFNSIGIINENKQTVYFNYVYTNISVILRDSNTKNLLSGINLTIDYVGTNYQTKKTTTSGLVNFIARFDELSDEVSLRAFSTLNTDYSIVIRYFTLTQDINSNITLYLTNTSDLTTTNLVKFVVLNNDLYLIEGARINIKKQDPATNTYLNITKLTTNSEGYATTILETDSAFYTWDVVFDGNIIYSSPEPVTISINDDTIRIIANVEESYTDYYNKINSVNVKNFTFIQLSNTTGYFKIYYNNAVSGESCIKVYKYNNSKSIPYLGQFCNNASTSYINSIIYNATNMTHFLSRYYVTFTGEPSQTYITASNGLIVGESIYTPLTQIEGVFIIMLVIIVSGVAFMSFPIVGLSLLAVSVLIISFTNLLYPYLSVKIALMIVSLCIISIYVVYKNGQ